MEEIEGDLQMMKKVLDKVEDLVMFKAKPTPEQQVKELDEQIEDLKKKRQIVLDGVDKKYVNKMLSRIMGQWVIVGGWSDDDEHPFRGQHYTIYKGGWRDDGGHPFRWQHYTIYKVVKALQWEGGNSFRIIAKHMMYLSAEGYLNGGIYEVDVNRRVKDIGNLAVISAEKAASIIRNARKVVIKRLNKALNEAQGDI